MALTAENVCEYVSSILPLPGCSFAPSDELSASEIHGGNLNYAFRVSSTAGPSRSIFVKQAPEYIKCLGPEAKLSSSRAVLESAVLDLHNQLAPSYTPRLLHFDPSRAVIVMEDLIGHVLLRDELIAGRVAVGDGRALGKFMGLTHSRTWKGSSFISDDDAASYASRFANDLLCGITSQYIFLKPYDASDATNRSSPGLQGLVDSLRAPGSGVASAAANLNGVFLGKKQCLIHGDLHSGSIMVARGVEGEPADEAYTAGRLRVFDPEFACYGPAAFDVGLVFAAYAFAMHRHATDGDATVVAKLREAMLAVWDEYATHLEGLPADDVGLELQTLREATGLAGAELVRRVIGAAHVADLETIEDEALRMRAEQCVLKAGSAALTGYRQVQEMADVLAMLGPSPVTVGE